MTPAWASVAEKLSYLGDSAQEWLTSHTVCDLLQSMAIALYILGGVLGRLEAVCSKPVRLMFVQ